MPSSQAPDEVTEESSRAHVLASQKAFNEKSCLRCCASFNFLFRKRLLCSSCRFYVCRHCAAWNSEERIWLCKFCEKKRFLGGQSSVQPKSVKRVPPYSIRSRKRSCSGSGTSSTSSAKATSSSTAKGAKVESETEVESDSGYDPSLSICSHDSSLKAHRPMRGLLVCPAAAAAANDNHTTTTPIPNTANTTLLNATTPPTNGADDRGNFLTSSQYNGDLSSLTEEAVNTNSHVLEIREHIETLVEQIIDNNLDNANLHPLYNHPEYDRMFHTFHARLSEALTQLSYSLYMVITNQPLGDTFTPTCAHTLLKKIVYEVLEEAMGLPPLNGSETGSLAATSPTALSDDDEYSDLLRLQSYEDILATAILNKVIEEYQTRFQRQRLCNDIALAEFVNDAMHYELNNMNRKERSHKEIQTEDETETEGSVYQGCRSDINHNSATSDAGSESAGEDFSWAEGAKEPLEYMIEEKIEEITTTVEESESDSERLRQRPVPMPRRTAKEPSVTKTLVMGEMPLVDMDFLYSGLNFNEADKVPFPELGLDIVHFNANALAEDGNNVEERDISVFMSASDNWMDNWLFRKKALLHAYKNMRGKVPACSDLVPMLIPNPLECARTRIGSREIDELSDLSERHSVGSVELFSTSETDSDEEDSIDGGAEDATSEFSPKDHEYTEDYMTNSQVFFPAEIELRFGNSYKNNNNNNNTNDNNNHQELNNLNKTDLRPVPLPRKTMSSIQPQTTKPFVLYPKSALSSSDSRTTAQNRSDSSTTTTLSGSDTCESDLVDIASGCSTQFVPVAMRGFPPKDLRFSSLPKNLVVHTGRAARFQCAVDVPSQISYEIAWFFGMERLVHDGRCHIFQKEHKAFLHIYNTDTHDEGTYSCVLFNERGQKWADFRLTVRGSIQSLKAPQFIEPLENSVAYEGGVASLTCKLVGHPEPQVFWYHDGRELVPTSSNYKIDELNRGYCILHLAEVSKLDEGDYVARAVNHLGECCTEAYLKIAPEGVKELYLLTKKMNDTQDGVHEEAEKLLNSANKGESSSAIRQVTGKVLDIFAAASHVTGDHPKTAVEESLNLPTKPGTIAEREHNKWLSPTASIPNNPYSPKNLARRAASASQSHLFSPNKQPTGNGLASSTNDLMIDESPRKIDCGLKTIDSTRYTRDYYVNERQLPKENSHHRATHTRSLSNEDVALDHVEEKVYVTVSKLSNLEDNIRKLEDQIENVKEDTPSRKVDVLEDRVASAAAQVNQSEKQVLVVEKEVTRLQRVFENRRNSSTNRNASSTPRHHRNGQRLTRAISLENLNGAARFSPSTHVPLIVPWQKPLSRKLSASIACLAQQVSSDATWHPTADRSESLSLKDELPSLPSVKELASRFQALQQPETAAATTTTTLPADRKKNNVVSVVSIYPQTSNGTSGPSMESKNVLTVLKHSRSPRNNNRIEVTDGINSDSGWGTDAVLNRPTTRDAVELPSVRQLLKLFSGDEASSSDGRPEASFAAAEGPVRRVHSLTARTLSREFREQAKRNLPRQMNRHSSISLDVDSESTSSPSCLPSPEFSYEDRVTTKRHHPAACHRSSSDAKVVGRNRARNARGSAERVVSASADADGHGYTSDESNASTNSLLYRRNATSSILRRAAYWDRRVVEGITSDNSLNEDYTHTFSS